MAGFTPVSSMIRNELADPIGVDQIIRRNRQTEFSNELARMAAETDQVNASQFQRQNDLQAQRQQMQIDGAKREEYRQTGISLLGWLDQNQGKPEYAQMLQQLAADPESQQAAGALGIDLAKLGDPAYRAVANAKLRVPVPEQVQQMETIQGPGGSILQRDPVTKKLTQVVAPRAPTGSGGPRGPNWQKVDYVDPKTGKRTVGLVDMNSPNPESTVRPIGDAPAPVGTLPVALEKRLMTTNDAAFQSRSNVSKYEGIAAQLEQVLPAGGVRGSWAEKLKEVTGSQDAVTELRTRWNEIRVSAAIANLPPGVASDKDIELAMSAFLPANANAATVASFLRGLAKVEALKADYHEFEADYISNRRTAAGLNQAWKAHAAENYGNAAQGANAGPPAPAGVDPSLWGAMTPEERALWQK